MSTQAQLFGEAGHPRACSICALSVPAKWSGFRCLAHAGSIPRVQVYIDEDRSVSCGFFLTSKVRREVAA